MTALYRWHLDTIYRYIYTRVGNRPQAEDLTAEIFTRMLEDLDQYDATRGTFQQWLYGIARHALTDFWRRYYRAASESWPVDILIEVAGYRVHFTEARLEDRSGTTMLVLTSVPLDHPRDDRRLAGLQFGAVAAPDGRTVNPDTAFAAAGRERFPDSDAVGPYRAWLTFDVADPETRTVQPGRYRVELAGATVAVEGPWTLIWNLPMP